MSKLFIGDKELEFFNSINKETIQRIVGQSIVYYAISKEFTNVDSLYNEAVEKVTYSPVEVNALVMFQEPMQTSTRFGSDMIYNIEAYVHNEEMEERNLAPRQR